MTTYPARNPTPLECVTGVARSAPTLPARRRWRRAAQREGGNAPASLKRAAHRPPPPRWRCRRGPPRRAAAAAPPELGRSAEWQHGELLSCNARCAALTPLGPASADHHSCALPCAQVRLLDDLRLLPHRADRLGVTVAATCGSAFRISIAGGDARYRWDACGEVRAPVRSDGTCAVPRVVVSPEGSPPQQMCVSTIALTQERVGVVICLRSLGAARGLAVGCCYC